MTLEDDEFATFRFERKDDHGPQDLDAVDDILEEREFRQALMDAGARIIAEGFVMFVDDILARLGLIDKDGKQVLGDLSGSPAAKLTKMTDDGLLSQWNWQARLWPINESRSNYRIIMQTLSENVRFGPGARREKVLSLGAGPGLYETFLAGLLSPMSMICTDYAEGMVEMANRIKNLATFFFRQQVRMQVQKEDMTSLSFSSGSIDKIICNNSLQWVPRWRQAIAEMARVIKKDGGILYLIINGHPMCHKNRGGRFCVAPHEIDDIFNVLERNDFEIDVMQQIFGEGVGQKGMDTDRIFVRATLKPGVIIRPWQSLKMQQ